LSFWAGQRYHRIQDIHVVDNWLMEDGDNYGAGVDGFGLGGGAKLNVALHTQGNADNHNSDTNSAKRFNFQVVDIPVNPGGKLTVTGALISGKFAQGKDGGALGMLHNQKDFLVNGLTNSVFVQASTGHASVNGKFYNLDTPATAPSLAQDALGTISLVPGKPAGPQGGAQQRRIVEVMNWQVGKFGGQALVGYQTTRPDGGTTQKDFSSGGRVSYGVARNVKLLGELGYTQRNIDGQDKQWLTKETFAVAFSPNTDFWNRPEFRVYVTGAQWNKAAASANSGSFGRDGRKDAIAFGVQMEAWWE
jgi:maltoporin